MFMLETDAGGQNKQHAGGKNTLTLDNETEELSHKHLGLSQARAIQQGRQDKGMTQKELATVNTLQLFFPG